MVRVFPAFLTIAATLWAVTLLAAPYALTSGHTHLASVAAVVYSAAGLICHQRSARSFHIAGVQLPVCGRCAGLYLSGAFGALLAWVVLRRPHVPSHTRRMLVVAAMPTALSVVLEWSGVVDPTNVGRALLALPLGAVSGWIFVQSLRGEGNI